MHAASARMGSRSLNTRPAVSCAGKRLWRILSVVAKQGPNLGTNLSAKLPGAAGVVSSNNSELVMNGTLATVSLKLRYANSVRVRLRRHALWVSDCRCVLATLHATAYGPLAGCHTACVFLSC